MSFKLRSILSFSLMISMTLLLGVILITASSLLRSRYDVYQREIKLYDLVSTILERFEKQRRSLDGYLVGIDSEKDQYADLESEIGGLISEWKKMVNKESEDREQKEFELRFNLLKPYVRQLFQFVETEKRKEAVMMMESNLLPIIEGLEKDIRSLAAKKKTNSDEFWKSAQISAHRTNKFSIAILVIVILAGIGFAVLIYQSISRPLRVLREGTQKVGAGHWDLQLNITSPSEMAGLARSFEDMAKSVRDLESKVVQMGRMSAVGTLAGGVAHEINNPLTGVLGQSQLLLEKINSEDPIRGNVEKIERAALRCKKIVRGLLDFSRAQDYDFKPLDVDQIIQNALSLCETEITALKIEIAWVKNPSLLKIMASEHHLQQVFLNIITNAVHAMPQGGQLMIATNLADLSNVPNRRKGDPDSSKFVEVSFKDSGVGIEAKNLSHIFDPFFTTKEPGKGTGLGLSISYGIVQQHQGQIRVESPGLGQGAKFLVYIPVAPNASQLELLKANSSSEKK